MIEVKNLTKMFGKEHYAVNHTTWEAPDGAITGFIGPNGAGKTTTIKMMTGSLKPTEGTVLLNGIDINKKPFEAKKQFGYVSDSPDHFLRLKGVEYLNFMADIYDVPQEDRVNFIEKYGKRFGIYEALNNIILSYSRGMRQKIMVMGVLIHNPSIWILDEPLLGLDPQSAFELKQMMREHCDKGNTVVFSTHVLEVAEKLCDRINIISAGEIKYTGTIENLKAQYPGEDLENIFLKLTGKVEGSEDAHE